MNPWDIAAWVAAISLSVLTVTITYAMVGALVKRRP